MLDFRWCGKILPDQSAPRRKILRAGGNRRCDFPASPLWPAAGSADGFSTDLCSSKPLPPLARKNSERALATAASKSFSEPGLTSIWAISVIIGLRPFVGTPLCNPTSRIIEAHWSKRVLFKRLIGPSGKSVRFRGIGAAATAKMPRKILARKNEIHRQNQTDWGCPVPPPKIFRWCRRANGNYRLPYSALTGGALAIVIDVGCGMRWTRKLP